VKKSLGFYPASSRAVIGRLLRAVSTLEAVEFRPVQDPADDSVNGLLLIDMPMEKAMNACLPKPTLAYLADCPKIQDAQLVRFNNSERLDSVLRGQAIFDNVTTHSLPGAKEGEVLATKTDAPVWRRHRTAASFLDIVSSGRPEFDDSRLYCFASSGASMHWIPLLHFIREVCGELAWIRPQPSACFMFDDPNLHWRNYGFIDFAKLAHDARINHYHAVMATVPIDAWYVNGRAANIFRDSADQLSLVVHGNNHTSRELWNAQSPTETERMVAQSVRRLQRLEQAVGEIPRIMTAPHGACSVRTARELSQQGYEAACLSPDSVRGRNPQERWPDTFGLEPAEFLAGLPVISRYALSLDCVSEAVWAMFLGKPVVIYGHHSDLAQGLSRLRELSRTINGLGAVAWLDLRQMARRNFKQRRDGGILHVRMYGYRLAIPLPAALRTVHLQAAWDKTLMFELSLEELSRGEETINRGEQEIRCALPAGSPPCLHIFVSPKRAPKKPSTRIEIWPLGRRLMTEARDRLQPFVRSSKANGAAARREKFRS